MKASLALLLLVLSACGGVDDARFQSLTTDLKDIYHQIADQLSQIKTPDDARVRVEPITRLVARAAPLREQLMRIRLSGLRQQELATDLAQSHMRMFRAWQDLPEPVRPLLDDILKPVR